MFTELEAINLRPKPFQFYTADELWTDEHTAKCMLAYHLNEAIDVSSRNKAFIERSSDWMASTFAIGKGFEIADFGCGPGLYTTQFAQKGATVTGIDFSENSLAHARKVAEANNLTIDYVRANYLDFETSSKFDLITMIMCDYCALSPVQRKSMLAKFSSLLKPTGSLLLDVYSLKAFDQKQEAATYERNHLDGFWSPDDYFCFINTFKYEEDKVSLDKYTIIENARTRVVYNWLQYFSQNSIMAEFEDSGFAIEAFFSNVAGDKYDAEGEGLEFAVVAKQLKRQ